jgi:hypothetical protein
LSLLTALPLQAEEEGLNRKIKLPQSKGTVYELLEKVTERSGFLFIYDNSVINNEQPANIKKGEYTVSQAIYEITGNPLLSLRISGSHILIQQSPSAALPSLPLPDTAPSDSLRYFTIEGTLLDRYTREPVSYATIGIPSDAIGTVSNRNGGFRLRLPDSLRYACVQFSHIGYLIQEFEVQRLIDSERIFLLEPRVISIQEVVVRLVNPLRLLHTMLDNRDANYPKKPVYFTSFYREGVEHRKGVVNLTEAVFKIYKAPYTIAPSGDQVKLLKMRRISNEDEQDTLITKIKSGINACLMLDVIKNLPDFLLPENEYQYNYLHGDITVIDNRIANMISFEQKKGIKDPLYKGEIFIDAENSALLSARFEIHPKYVEKATDMLVTRKSKNLHIVSRQVVYTVSYKPWNGTYYVNHIRGDLYFRIRKRNQLFSSTTLHTWFEMATCKIETENITRFTRNETLQTRTIFAETNFNYDNDFWGNFNIILPEEKLNEALAGITSRIEEFEEKEMIR